MFLESQHELYYTSSSSSLCSSINLWSLAALQLLSFIMHTPETHTRRDTLEGCKTNKIKNVAAEGWTVIIIIRRENSFAVELHQAK